MSALPARTEEGALEVHGTDALVDERFCWGYGRVLAEFLLDESSGGDGESRTSSGATELGRPHPGSCDIWRVAADSDLGNWASAEQWG